jgi:WXXGXW repeat (2 copies)
MIKRTAITLLAVAAILAPAALTPAAAQLGVSINIGTPPPAPIYEAVPASRVGYVWAPGYWRWEHERHVWAPGHWIEGRRGHHWVADHWVEGPHSGWRHDAGHWDRD